MVDDEPLRRRLSSGVRADGYYEYMLTEDIGHIMPFGRGIDDGFKARVIGDHRSKGDGLVCEALPTRYGGRALTDAVRDFFSQVAQLLVLSGEAAYEIDYLSDPGSETKTPTSFRLEPLPDRSLDWIDGTPIQFVPSSMSDKITKDGLAYVTLESDRLVTFGLPESAESGVRHAIEFLVAASQQQGAGYALLEKSMEERADYNVTEHHKQTGELLLRATRPLGWTARGLHRDQVLDPYSVWRQLRFKRFRVELRDAILEQLNAVLDVAGEVLGIPIQLEISDVVTVDDLDEAEAALESGSRALSDVVALAL